ncbi:MAG: AGE family epimerase/isomerase [Planctomycetes bacterium]|nr:AGE family epimerase/isomerase [Planctomycetota bacterium]
MDARWCNRPLGMILAISILWIRAAPAAPPLAIPEAPDAAAYARLVRRLDAHLREGVLATWYPRCVDTAKGGFRERFARDWTPLADGDRFLVYQARMTWTAAAAILYDPKLAQAYRPIALHGLRYLDGAFRDREKGGLFFRIGEDGARAEDLSAEKHAYGISFAIYAAAAVHAATKEPRARALAIETFRWLDAHAHDAENGGYFEALARDGTPIRTSPRGGSEDTTRDGIGTPHGYKSMNTHIHLLEAFTALHEIDPDPLVRDRLEELLRIVRDTIAVDPGCLNYYFTPDWRAVPMHDSFGHDIETAFLLVEATEALGRPDDPATWRMARKIVDHALAWGWDEKNGGFFEGGQAFAPAHDRKKIWWTQAEGLNALLLMHQRFGEETDRYWRAFARQLRFIWEHQIDHEHGDWFGDLSEDGTLLGNGDKASPWKAAYHNGRALMATIERLGALAGGDNGDGGAGYRALVYVPSAVTVGTWAVLARDGANRQVDPYLSSLGAGEYGTGAIASPSFTVAADAIAFTICGHDGQGGGERKNFIALADATTGRNLRRTLAPGSDAMVPQSWDVKDLRGREVRIEVHDGMAAGAYAWLGVGMIDAGPALRVDFRKGMPEGWKTIASAKPEPERAAYETIEGGIPFRSLRGTMLPAAGAAEIPCGFAAERLFVLGCTVPRGTPLEVRGAIEILYRGGATDRVPLMVGFTLEGECKLKSPSKALYLHATPDPFQYYLVIAPRAEVIEKIRIAPAPGFDVSPRITAITCLTAASAENLEPLPEGRLDPGERVWIGVHAISPISPNVDEIAAEIRRANKM